MFPKQADRQKTRPTAKLLALIIITTIIAAPIAIIKLIELWWLENNPNKFSLKPEIYWHYHNNNLDDYELDYSFTIMFEPVQLTNKDFIFPELKPYLREEFPVISYIIPENTLLYDEFAKEVFMVNTETIDANIPNILHYFPIKKIIRSLNSKAKNTPIKRVLQLKQIG